MLGSRFAHSIGQLLPKRRSSSTKSLGLSESHSNGTQSAWSELGAMSEPEDTRALLQASASTGMSSCAGAATMPRDRRFSSADQVVLRRTHVKDIFDSAMLDAQPEAAPLLTLDEDLLSSSELPRSSSPSCHSSNNEASQEALHCLDVDGVGLGDISRCSIKTLYSFKTSPALRENLELDKSLASPLRAVRQATADLESHLDDVLASSSHESGSPGAVSKRCQLDTPSADLNVCHSSARSPRSLNAAHNPLVRMLVTAAPTIDGFPSSRRASQSQPESDVIVTGPNQHLAFEPELSISSLTTIESVSPASVISATSSRAVLPDIKELDERFDAAHPDGFMHIVAPRVSMNPLSITPSSSTDRPTNSPVRKPTRSNLRAQISSSDSRYLLKSKLKETLPHFSAMIPSPTTAMAASASAKVTPHATTTLVAAPADLLMLVKRVGEFESALKSLKEDASKSTKKIAKLTSRLNSQKRAAAHRTTRLRCTVDLLSTDLATHASAVDSLQERVDMLEDAFQQATDDLSEQASVIKELEDVIDVQEARLVEQVDTIAGLESCVAGQQELLKWRERRATHGRATIEVQNRLIREKDRIIGTKDAMLGVALSEVARLNLLKVPTVVEEDEEEEL
ncbi:hypothetical protein BKA62DRAFT_682441 [Auriculariales sp. MPI-PUGE-AT-0066]|nr:hypothetical protein BKA62DRAFT_682441 [Auriculariales sp. MPI-PUGE-AT-0066]